jgi:palmitoyltransferase
VPPYHPDYGRQELDNDEDSLSTGDEMDDDNVSLSAVRGVNGRVRRGSEGYEVRPILREQMLRQYLESVGEDYDRYIRYIPQPELEIEGEVKNGPVEATTGA